MKALSLTQPWATLIAIGAKRIETRSWATNYRGLVAIHAAKGMPRWAREFAYENPAGQVLNDAGILLGGDCTDLPHGAILAVAMLSDVWPTDGIWQRISVRAVATPHEEAFGDYGPDRYGWLFGHVSPLAVPIPCKGSLGLWTPPPDILERLL